MKLGALCSGVGALELAVTDAFGAEIVWQSEIDADASRVLAARFAGVANLGDLRVVDWAGVEPVDVMCFGFPCQDLSSAGRGAGIEKETRSGLWYACLAAVRTVRPRIVVVENVAALVTRRRGLDFTIVMAGLAEAGYDTEWCCFRASDVGAPHRRERVFILATDAHGGELQRLRGPGVVAGPSRDAESETRERERSGDAAVHSGAAAADTDMWRREGGAQLDCITGQDPADGCPCGRHAHRCDIAVADTDSAARGQQGAQPAERYNLPARRDWGPYAAAIARWERILGRPAPDPVDRRGRLSPAFDEWMMGLPAGWVTDVVGRTAALRCLGNGVVPLQAATAIRALAGVGA